MVTASTRSPGETTLAMALSNPPVPLAGKINMSFSVWKAQRRPASSSGRRALNSGPRWLIMGAAIARCTRSGTGVGPGIRNWGG